MIERIALLTPTRNRPGNVTRLLESVVATTASPQAVEVVFYVDDDDTMSAHAFTADRWRRDVVVITGPRIPRSGMWNECAKETTAQILFLCNDDILFRTPGWDAIVRGAFARYPDRLVMVHGSDGFRADIVTMPFLHRRWVETVGYFAP